MKKTSITEKTLELNICEEYLVSIRKEYPKSYWYGPSTREERDLGYDARMEGAEGYALFLQFKRPLYYPGTNPETYPYKFKVQTHQHKTLKLLSKKNLGSVQYAFPLIGDAEELRVATPNLRFRTYFCDLENTPNLSDDRKDHKVEVYPNRAIFYSTPFFVEGYSGRWLRSQLRAKLKSLLITTFGDFVKLYNALILAFATDLSVQGRDLIAEEIPRALFVHLEQ